MQRRKVTLRLYPTPKQEAVLEGWLALHRQLYNAALEERIDAYRKFGLSISYNQQQNTLPALKKEMPELAPLGSQALQETLRRLDRSFSAFFSRCASGKTPGFPRFKGKNRFNSFTYPSPAGWCFTPLQGLDAEGGAKKNQRKALLRVGDLTLKARGMSRFDAFLGNDVTVKRVAPGRWEASLTLRVSEVDCARERAGNAIRGFDQGLTDRIVFDNGEVVENTRLLRNKLEALACLQQRRARCTKRSRQYKALTVAIARMHRDVANQRKDELHKFTSGLVSQCAFLGSEELDVANMTRAPAPKPEVDAQGEKTGQFLPNGAASKAGLSRELMSAGFGMMLQMITYKAQEAGTTFHLANTRKLKPSQRCACCGQTVKKDLKERTHACPNCGFATGRDQNAALVCLMDGLWPGYYDSLQEKKGKKKPFFAPDGFASLISNRLFYAAQQSSKCSLSEQAHGTGVYIGSAKKPHLERIRGTISAAGV